MQMARATGVLFTAALVASCSLVYREDLDTKQCTTNEDCVAAGQALGYPLACEENVCRQLSCASQVDCPANAQCVNAVCVSPDAGIPSVSCTQNSDCPNGLLCGFDNFCYDKWACLDSDRDWTANTNGTYRTYVRNFGTSTPVTGVVTGKACALSDPECRNPVVPSSAVAVDPAQQLVSVPFTALPRDGFTGSINIDIDAGAAPPVPDGGYSSAYYPGVVHFSSQNPMVADLSPQTDLLLASPALVSVIAAGWVNNIPYPVDPNKALMVLQVHDCGGRKAAGMKLTPRATAETATVLFVPIESKTSPNPALTKTTEDGAALLFNLPGAAVTFTLTDEDQNKVINDRIAVTLKSPGLNYFAYYPRRAAVEKWMTYAKSQGLVPQ